MRPSPSPASASPSDCDPPTLVPASKSVGPERAIATILQATHQALALLDSVRWPGALAASQAPDPPPLSCQAFRRVWLGLAGVTNAADIAAFVPHARWGFCVVDGDKDGLWLTNGTPQPPAGSRRSRSLERG